MRNGSGPTYVGCAAIVGGVMGLLLAPVMVIIKYMTGWAIIPEPMWVGAAQEALGGLLQFATPPGLWTTTAASTPWRCCSCWSAFSDCQARAEMPEADCTRKGIGLSLWDCAW